jgi:serine/threonine protein kinase
MKVSPPARSTTPTPSTSSTWGVTAEGSPYLVMEYLEGQTLRALVYKKKLTPERAVDIMLPGAFVLAVAHERGIIHRDIKPENIFLDVHHGHEVVKVLDFGLAAFREELEGKTREETVKGSPSYLSPERVAGIPSDGRADVYAAGCVLFEMLCGRPPFIREAGQSAAELASSHILKLAPEVSDFNPDVPEALVRLVAETLEKKPANRLTSSRFALRLAAVRDAMGSPPAR